MLNEDYRQRTQRYIELLQRQKDTIFRLCLRRARLHPDRVNDLMQEVYVRLWRSLDTLPADAGAAEEDTWVRRLTRSVLSHDNRRRRPATVPLEHAADVAADDGDRHRRQTLDELVAFLSDDDRQLVQRYCQGYSIDEIARERHLAPNTVKNRLTLVRRRLYEINNLRINNNNKNDMP